MKIVMIGPMALFSEISANWRMRFLADALCARGHEMSLIIPPYDNLQEAGKDYKLNNIHVYNVNIPRIPTPLKQLIVALRLAKKTVELKPDVIHIFKPIGYSGLAAMFLIVYRKFMRKKIALLVDTDDWEGRGGWSDYWLTRHIHPRYQVDFMRFQEKWVPRHVDAVTVASRTLQTQIWSLGIPPEKVFYIPNGAHTFKKAEEVTNIKNVILLYTKFFEFKIQRVIDILKIVKDEIKDVRLLVVGKGKFGEEKELAELAEREGLKDSVMFTGWVEMDKLPSVLKLGTVAMYPFDDTLLNRAKSPGKLVDLMSLGMVVVADRVGDIAEYIENEKSGITVDPEDTHMFARNVIRLLKDENLRVVLGRGARERIYRVFEWSRLALKVEMAYEKARSK